ncbi:MAG: DUF29 domain-containing protein [Chloroflexi bacterium]|nr:MAG: DUF29 domain-containing protein [Chloroflexota bacterium]
MSVYERDFYAWTLEQANLLRDHQFAKLDIDNLIEELESMGRSERRQLASRLEVLLVHLLKWQYQPELRGRSWELTILEQRRRIRRLLRDNPSLQSELPALLTDAYDDARFGALRETGLSLPTFPEALPYLPAQLLDDAWLPE